MWLIILLFISVAFIIYTTARLKWHPFFSLLATAFGYGSLSGTMSLQEVVKSVNTGFGNTAGVIGIVILAGSIIGKFLEKTGGAFTLADGTLKITGKKNVPLALSFIGYILSIPVFCDSGFIIMAPLAKALTKQAGISFAIGATALSLGLIVTHSIIPPTPGPVGAAGILNADLGMVILLGLPVSIIGMLAGWLFAIRIASKVNIDPISGEPAAEMNPQRIPPLFKAVLPVFVPLVLIILRSIGELSQSPFGSGTISSLIGFTGQPVVALLIGVLLSFLLPRKLTRNMISTSGWMGEAIAGAATIIIITGCGGAFGQVLQNSGIGEVIKNNLSEVRNLGILLPVIIAAALKTAQGSGTVAIITGASLMAPLLGSLGMDSDSGRALVAVALGAGGMIASHANDSYFWVVTQFSGMSVNQGYRLQTLGTLTVGICASLAVIVISIFIL
ncbi:MAG: GntP family permease [Bacteroidales bacterium]|nr:GntP family permease [Bacteroidales bacterium]